MRLSAILPALTAFPLVRELEAPILGYGVEEFTWEVKTKPGGPTVALNGTVQDIYARLIEINPTYNRDFAARNTSPKTLDGFNNIADSAQVIVNQCSADGYVSGEENHADHWRGIPL
ncbi:hypothetical protein ATERTT37_006529 [Aspergillus terreus]